MNPDDIPPSRRSQFSIDALTTAWKEVLADEAVCSLVSRRQVDNWQESLRQSSVDPSTYWVNWIQSRPDRIECADFIVKAMQDMLDCRTEVAARSESSRVLRYILLKFVWACNAVPSFLFISDHLRTVDVSDRARYGGFSDVYPGVLTNERQVAIKRLRIPAHQNGRFVRILCREASIWRQLKHSNILPFLGLATVGQLNSDVCMVSPWMSGGSLGLWLTVQPIVQSDDKIRWIRQVCSGMRYLHEMCIIHGDLRGTNILLDAENNACIADFGVSQLMDAGDTTMNMTTRTGSIRWMAPEVLKHEECSYASDVYSFACTCLEIVTQTRPLPEIKGDRAFKKYLRKGNGPTWPIASTGNDTLDSLGSWIAAGFLRKPAKRPTMDQLYHSFEEVDHSPPTSFSQPHSPGSLEPMITLNISTDSVDAIGSSLMQDHLMDIITATVLDSLPNARRIKETYSQFRYKTVFDNWICCCQFMEDGKQMADAILCQMQQMLDRPYLPLEHDDLRLLRRTMMEFSIKSQVIPSVLFLHDVRCHESEPRRCDNYSSIFYGELGSQAVALKRLQKNRYYKYLCGEALLWRQLRHPSVLAFLGLKEHPSGGFVDMISPWMAHDSITNYMREHHTAVSPPLKRRWLFEVADGLSYLHDNGIIHGDLRGDNILLDEQNNAHLADFGLADFVDAGLDTFDMSGLDAIRWASPEMLMGGECTFASDVYSYASTCLEIVSGTRPFPNITSTKIAHMVLKGGLCPTWPHTDYPGLHDIGLLVTPAWSVDPESRPRITDLRDTMTGINEEKARVGVAGKGASVFARVSRDATHDLLDNVD